jgi:hypothetical protein
MPMKSRIVLRWASAVAGLLMLSGCAAAVLLSMDPDQRAALFLVPGDKAAIYIYHDDTVDDATAPVVNLDGEPLGVPTAAGYWYRYVEPGRHTIAIAGAEADGLVLEVEAGRVYFVGEDVDCGATPLPYVHAVKEAAGRARVRALVAASKSPLSDGRNGDALACGPRAPGANGDVL